VIADAREQAERWCSALWGDRQGWALTAVGRSPQMSSGRFRHACLDQFPYQWPDDRDRLLSELLPLADGCDVYVAPLLRSAPNRRNADSEPLDGQHVWLDADEWDEERERVLAGYEAPVLRVQSGGAHGRMHLYLDVGERRPGHQIARMAQLLSQDLRTDTYGGANKLLRLPGTMNHKPVLLGQPAGAVILLP